MTHSLLSGHRYLPWTSSITELLRWDRWRQSCQGQRHHLPAHRSHTTKLRLWHVCVGPCPQVTNFTLATFLTFFSSCRRRRFPWRCWSSRTETSCMPPTSTFLATQPGAGQQASTLHAPLKQSRYGAKTHLLPPGHATRFSSDTDIGQYQARTFTPPHTRSPIACCDLGRCLPQEQDP